MAGKVFDEQYGKLKERHRKKDNGEHKEEEGKEPKGYFTEFNGKEVEIKLVSGEVMRGILQANRYNKFQVLLSNSQGCYLVNKGAIMFLREFKEGEP